MIRSHPTADPTATCVPNAPPTTGFARRFGLAADLTATCVPNASPTTGFARRFGLAVAA